MSQKQKLKKISCWGDWMVLKLFNVLKKDTKIDDVWTSYLCACKKKKRMREKKKSPPRNTHVCGW
jgi:hypothetical protein